MTTHATGNALGSDAPLDLLDNAENFDYFSLGSEPSYPDRLGEARKSIKGMEYDFAELLLKSGFESAHLTYVVGTPLSVARSTQLIDYSGSVYRVKMPSAFPVALTGTWATDAPKLVDVSDLSLRLELASSVGAGSVKWNGRTVGSWLDRLTTREVSLLDFIPEGQPDSWLSLPFNFNTAFNAAQASLTRPGMITIPNGFFSVNETINIRTDIPLKIRGQGMYSTVLYCTSALAGLPMFKATGAAVDNHHLEDFTILGNGFATIGYQCETLIHSSFSRVMVQGTTAAAIRTNNGYNVFFTELQILSNTGSGLDITGMNNNNVNLISCNIYANDGVGAKIANGWGVTLAGCSIEANKEAGLMCWDLRGLRITGGYMERNGAIGHTYSTADGSPENLTIKADIHLLSGGRTIGLGGDGMKNCIVDGVSFTPYGSGDVPTAGLRQHCHIFATTLENLRVTNNDTLEVAHVDSMIGLYNNGTKTLCTSLVLEQNTLNTISYIGTGTMVFAFGGGHNIENKCMPMPFNYASQVRTDYVITAGTTGATSDSAQKYGNITGWDMSPGDRLYGYLVDIAARPYLRGKYVWFGIAYRVQEVDTGLQISFGGSTDNDGSILEGVTPAGEWRIRSITKYIDPAATTQFIGFKRLGAGTQAVVVAAPALAVIGAGMNSMNLRR